MLPPPVNQSLEVTCVSSLCFLPNLCQRQYKLDFLFVPTSQNTIYFHSNKSIAINTYVTHNGFAWKCETRKLWWSWATYGCRGFLNFRYFHNTLYPVCRPSRRLANASSPVSQLEANIFSANQASSAKDHLPKPSRYFGYPRSRKVVRNSRLIRIMAKIKSIIHICRPDWMIRPRVTLLNADNSKLCPEEPDEYSSYIVPRPREEGPQFHLFPNLPFGMFNICE